MTLDHHVVFDVFIHPFTFQERILFEWDIPKADKIILNIWSISACASCDKSTTLFFLCIFRVHLQNQSYSKQYVKGSYMVRYWSTVDGMWCYTYYHLDFNKGCWRETCNHVFRPLKLFPTWLSRISIISSPVTYLTSFTACTGGFTRA